MAVSLGIEFARFWQAHPRPRNKGETEALFVAAVADGVRPAWLVQTAARYGAARAGEANQYLAASDVWLAMRRWEDFVDQPGLDGFRRQVQQTGTFWAEKIKSGRYVPSSAISDEVAAFMVASGLVTTTDLRRIGVQI